MIQAVNSHENLVNRLAALRIDTVEAIHRPAIGLGSGLLVASLAGAPMPLPELALFGPLLAFSGAGAVGARAASAVGFFSFLVFASASPMALVLAGVISIATAWGIPELLKTRTDAREAEVPTSAVVVDCDGFASLDEIYGEGASAHVFAMLQRALKHEARDTGLVVEANGNQLILVIGGSTSDAAAAIMERVEARFAGWLADVGYKCDLCVDLSIGRDDEEARFESLMRVSGSLDGPYMD